MKACCHCRIALGTVLLALLPGGLLGGSTASPAVSGKESLRIVVMDPLAVQLACKCVEGFAQRRYERLGKFLESRLDRPVQLTFAESLHQVAKPPVGDTDLIIGKWSVVVFDAASAKLPVHPLADLTDTAGSTDLVGLFVVRSDDMARSIAGLKGRTVLFGPAEAAEKHAAAFAALQEHGIPVPKPPCTTPSCNESALAVVEKKADCAVISGYALPLLEACQAVERGSLRVVGTTRPLPFVTAFATARVSEQTERAITDALLAVRTDRALLAAMESRDGFLPVGAEPGQGAARGEDWPDWRGPRRDGISPSVPAALPAKARFVWMQPLAGPGLSGVAVAANRVIVADKSEDGRDDVFRCLDAATGAPLWQLRYSAPDPMDFTNCPRAHPVIRDGLVYLLGAFGHLHCLRLDTGEVRWKRDLRKDFGARLPRWGLCAAPLLVADKLIVNPGGKAASVVALDRRTGKVVWTSPGRPAAYASFILATLGGVQQVVGYDATSLGGWDPETGRRLWELIPDQAGDYNVPTPIALDGKLLVATENNGTRLYAFDAGGRILPSPVAASRDLAPDASSPVVLDGRVFGCSKKLICLDARDGLRTLWTAADDSAFADHVSIIGGCGRLLISASSGELILIRSSGQRCEVVSRLRLFADRSDIWSHPALVANRLYLRTPSAVLCVALDTAKP
jgi:outer membrane protein assembly factor BamB/ABC-type phosphate/phosphonate transport system substrate-binding protein